MVSVGARGGVGGKVSCAREGGDAEWDEARLMVGVEE